MKTLAMLLLICSYGLASCLSENSADDIAVDMARSRIFPDDNEVIAKVYDDSYQVPDYFYVDERASTPESYTLKLFAIYPTGIVSGVSPTQLHSDSPAFSSAIMSIVPVPTETCMTAMQVSSQHDRYPMTRSRRFPKSTTALISIPC